MQSLRLLPLFAASLLVTGCSRPATLFSEQNARAHVEMLAGTIGSRPAGSAANARARAYVIDQLRLYGYDVRVQETDARRAEIGRSARVANIIAVLPGERREAVGILSHYDTRADTPGAGDDAFGVAVSLEAARVIAARPSRRWTTFVLMTDAEEDGLMGAAALMTDPQVRDELAVYVNLEAIGSTGTAFLFESGPANAWLLKPWARNAPDPRGGSYAIEIYRRLPNDTDFSILRRHQVPGLNFAVIGNSYVYHTSRDTPDRLSDATLRDSGDNVIGVVDALQSADILARTTDDATYFDIGRIVAWSHGSLAAAVIAALSIVVGILAWLRVTRYLVAAEGFGPWLLGLFWVLLGAAVTVAAMVGATAALRAAREVYHPWYARPDRLFLLLASVGACTAWMMARAGRWVPSRARGLRHPAVAWTYTLPAWIALAGFMSWVAPSAGYLWTLPLLTAGVLLLVLPVANAAFGRIAAVIVLAVAATLWLRDAVELLRFVVAIFGRQPIVTPVFVYAALIAAAGLMLAPPFFAATTSPAAVLRPSLMTALLLAAVATTGTAAWLAPAYTNEQPQRRFARAIQETPSGPSVWQVSSHEPGVDLGDGAPIGWAQTEPAFSVVPFGRLSQPFVFSRSGPPVGAAPASVTRFALTATADGGGTLVTLVLAPRETSLTASIVLPQGVTPARSNLPGVPRAGRWTATYVAIPADGISWEASFAGVPAERLREARVILTAAGLPEGTGWQRLPGWLPEERTAWSAWTTWVLDPSLIAPLEPVPPLR